MLRPQKKKRTMATKNSILSFIHHFDSMIILFFDSMIILFGIRSSGSAPQDLIEESKIFAP